MIWSLSGLVIGYILLLIFPQVLFANKLEYKNFSVYYHSKETNIQDLKIVLDKSVDLLKATKLFSNRFEQDIFICNDYREFSCFALFHRKSSAINFPLIQNIFITKSSISDNLVIRNEIENNIRTLSGVIAHETTHSLLENQLGFIRNRFFPTWKKEGYCDFIAKESSYNGQEGLFEICKEPENDNNPSLNYYRYRIYTQYLFEDKKISLGDFLYHSIELSKLKKEIKEKYCHNRLFKLTLVNVNAG